jgi:hypothetical protein
MELKLTHDWNFHRKPFYLEEIHPVFENGLFDPSVGFYVQRINQVETI